jgi:endoglucanase
MMIEAGRLGLGLAPALMILTLLLLPDASPAGVVQQWGQLRVIRGQLCDERGNPVQLKGMSTHGLQFFPVSKSTIDHMVDDWHCTVIRAAMYTKEKGYIDHPARLKDQVKLVVDQCIARGIYVIIDWHILSDNDPNIYRDEARAFFDEMSATYGRYPNVLYEICNEPHDCSWTGEIKPYAEAIIPVIRANAPGSVIICGDENWSSEPQAAANMPLDLPNILYTLHYYAATHALDQWMQKVDSCMAKGCAVFVSEWSTCEANGDGRIDLPRSQRMVDFLAAKKVSWCIWALSPGNHSCDILKPGAGIDGPWSDDQLSITGRFARENIVK